MKSPQVKTTETVNIDKPIHRRAKLCAAHVGMALGRFSGEAILRAIVIVEKDIERHLSAPLSRRISLKSSRNIQAHSS